MTSRIRSLIRYALPCFVTGLVSQCFGCSQPTSGGERLVLDNGVTVLLKPIDGVDHVGVEAFYDVGFIHEPKNMTQASHLLEHLVCYGSSESFAEKEAMQTLNKAGMSNAETMPTRTHYDYVLPSEKLGLAIQIERERLTSLKFTKAMIQVEAARCYQETDMVESNPASGMMKHAFMAFSQAWRHNAKNALVRGGLEKMSVSDLVEFHQAYYRPKNLTLVIVGKFDLGATKELVHEKIGTIPGSSHVIGSTINWDTVPARQTVTWDAKLRGICLAFPPPEDPTTSAALSLFGNLLMQKLYLDPELKRVAYMTICSHSSWKVDPLPFFVYAAAREGQSLEDVERTLKNRLQTLIKESKPLTVQLPLVVNQLQAQSESLNEQLVHSQARMLQNARGMDKDRATGMVLGQAALNWGMADQLLNGDAKSVAAQLKSMVGPKLNKLIDETLSESEMRVTIVVPAQ